MIPRRVSRHVKEQNWFAVFLDLVVVVVGIFIALQVSQWHNDSEQRAERIYLLEKLAEDINNTLEEHKETIEAFDAVREDFTVLISMLSKKPTDDNAHERFFKAYNVIFNTYDTTFESPTFEYILNSGNLDYLGRIETQNQFLKLNSANLENNFQTEILNQLLAPIIVNVMAKIVVPEQVNDIQIGSSLNDVYEFPELLGHTVTIRNVAYIQRGQIDNIDTVLNNLLVAVNEELAMLQE
ncbi:hypothetical protein [Glaciecola sp. 1036]|uniref:hypothetical protein n=1 Tax=Alteromonadaceae TaxID=72275 RepID=UPI003CFE97E0